MSLADDIAKDTEDRGVYTTIRFVTMYWISNYNRQN